MRIDNANQTALDQLHAHELMCDACRTFDQCKIYDNLLRKSIEDLRVGLRARTQEPPQ